MKEQRRRNGFCCDPARTNPPSPAPQPRRLKRGWRTFRSWPKAAQISVWALTGLIGVTALGPGRTKTPPPVHSTGQVATTTTTTGATAATSAPTTSSSTAPTTTTTIKPTTTTTAAPAPTTTTRPATTTTIAAPTTTTTAAPTTTTQAVASVHPGAFCSPDGAVGYTSAGTRMVCSTTPADSRDRWRAG